MKSSPAKTQVVMPTRNPNETIQLAKCREGYACMDLLNFKKFIKNQINTETYIQQLQNLLKELAEPIKGN